MGARPLKTPMPINNKQLLKQNQVKQMSFGEAVLKAVDGFKMTRKEWNNDRDFIFIENDILMLMKNDKKFSLLVSIGDIINNDWIVIS